MANNYYCPICRSNMNIGNTLVFSAKSPDNEKGLIFLNTELGDYSKTTHPDFELLEGVEYKFYCPVCHAKLNKEENPNLVKVHMTDETGQERGQHPLQHIPDALPVHAGKGNAPPGILPRASTRPVIGD